MGPLVGALRRVWLPTLLGVGTVLAFFAPLVSPSRALISRDIPIFHLPLRTAFVRLAAAGLPEWNPLIHGGQPILSNPNYAAFYPPSWIAFLVGPIYALNLLVLLHAGLAFAGAWVLARRLGGGRGAAALAAVGFAGGGGFVSLTHSFNLLCGMAWLPWALVGAERLLTAERGGRWLGAAVGCGTAVALQLLAGEPVAVLISTLGITGLALDGLRRRPRVVPRLVVAALVATLLAAVQLVPTWHRVAGSPRGEALELERATVWSMPPGRLVELVFPHFWGDPARVEEDLYFGWSLHDRGFPYVISIYPGLLLTLVGGAALLRGPVPRRLGWVVMAGGGLFFALGRHNPLYAFLHEHLPLLSILRYPEKFVLAAVAALTFAGALGFERLLAERRDGRLRRVDLPLALAASLSLCALVLTAWLVAVPGVAELFVHAGSALLLTPPQLEAAAGFLVSRGVLAAAITAGAALLLVLLRRASVSPRLLVGLAVAFLVADLRFHGHALTPTTPIERYRDPPPLAERLADHDFRIYASYAFGSGDTSFYLRREDSGSEELVQSLEQLEPYAGNLWGLAYALNPDFDLMLTRPARQTLEALRPDGRSATRGAKFLGGWNVGAVVVPRTIEEILEAEGPAPPAELWRNPYVLDRYRFVPSVVFHPTLGEAMEAMEAGGLELVREEHWVRPGRGRERRGPTPRPKLLGVADTGKRITVDYRAPTEALLVVGSTYDPGWHASRDGEDHRIYRTALGQMGLVLPAAERGRVELTYRDPWVPRGAAVTLLGILASLLVLVVPAVHRRLP